MKRGVHEGQSAESNSARRGQVLIFGDGEIGVDWWYLCKRFVGVNNLRSDRLDVASDGERYC